MGSVAVLASGSGSNFEAICEFLRPGPHRVNGLLCDHPQAPVLARAQRLAVPTAVVQYAGGAREARREAECKMEAILRSWDADLVALAGFMKVLSRPFVDAFSGRIINIHPSLLPKYPGLHAIERAYEAAETEFGITVHEVDHGVDSGRILRQASLLKAHRETLAELENRIHELEHSTYPEVIRDLLDTADGKQPAGPNG